MPDQKEPVLEDTREVPVAPDGEMEKVGLSYETLDNGNIIKIRGEKSELLEAALKVCKTLDSSYLPKDEDKPYLLAGDEIRPGGVWAVMFDKSKNEIWVQNRNGRGNEEYNRKMLEAVTSVIG